MTDDQIKFAPIRYKIRHTPGITPAPFMIAYRGAWRRVYRQADGRYTHQTGTGQSREIADPDLQFSPSLDPGA